jgi:hypothetical protein
VERGHALALRDGRVHVLKPDGRKPTAPKPVAPCGG